MSGIIANKSAQFLSRGIVVDVDVVLMEAVGVLIFVIANFVYRFPNWQSYLYEVALPGMISYLSHFSFVTPSNAATVCVMTCKQARRSRLRGCRAD